MMKIKKTVILYFLLFSFFSCSRENSDKTVVSSSRIDNKINFCECLNDFGGERSYMEYEFRILSCLGLYRNRKTDEIPFMQFAAQNCPDFFYRLSEQEITHSGYQLDNFIPIQNENCKNSYLIWGQNPIHMSNSTTYLKGDSILHFRNGLHDQTFKYLYSNNCTSFFEVIKEVNDSHILLNVGDTFSRERIAYFEDLFLVEFRFKKFVSLELEKNTPDSR